MNGAHGMSAEIDNMQAANRSKTSQVVLPSTIFREHNIVIEGPFPTDGKDLALMHAMADSQTSCTSSQPKWRQL